ncbi:DDC1 DNA damage checkpoint protein 1 [Candida maltosa Xu316]|uniref:DNA repair protein rad9 n=1 Tax=Candida maltosa (strain Xu316) TaxID=1245528 RepID=M3JW57_CANMX|nr:hypothetical protein G210_2532 [Candida maltosa Xu316]
MAFEAEIGANKHKLMWSKSIASLASISEAIVFRISKDSLSISATNISKTSHAEIVFKKSFFSNYIVEFNNILPEGYEKGVVDTESTYSFLVNSRHLATLFKSLDSNSVKYVCFRINWSQNSPINSRYKLFVEIKTKKLIVKKFQTSYIPVTKQPLKVAATYKDALYCQAEEDFFNKSRIHHIMIDQVIPKQFLEMVPASAEDFKIDIKNEKVSFCGYTKQVIKDRDYLKQPMAVTVTISLDELTDTNLISLNPEHEPARKVINFGMRDFKNFLNLISFFTASSSYADQFDEDYVTLANNDYFHIFFRNPGDPILFDLQSNQHVDVQYVQITSEDKSDLNSRNIDSDLVRKELVIDAPVPQKFGNQQVSETPSIIAKPSSSTFVNTTFGKPSLRKPVPIADVSEQDQFDDAITYRQDSPPPPPPPRANIHDADTDYSDDDDDDNNNTEPPTKRTLIPNELGPTQLSNKAKSIF